ncbi:MAG: hypothetical protein H7X71_01970, partial [Chitinophagales bacterium]|nr:hypothetical protein [Chitinophagales bacterium]
LENLFNALVKAAIKKTEPAKEELFPTTFAAVYDPKKDYLLRNELRLLTDIICRYMAEQEMLNELNDNEPVYHNYLLRNWYNRKLKDLFHQNVGAWKREAETGRYYIELIDMHMIEYNAVMRDFEDSAEKVQKLIQLVQACSEVIDKLFVYKWWSLESQYQSVHNYKNVASGRNIPVEPRKPMAHAFDSFPDDDFVLAMKYENMIYSAQKNEYLTLLQNAYLHCKKLMGEAGKGIYKTCRVTPAKFFCVLNERLMIILCSEGKVEEAQVYAEELEHMMYETKIKFADTFNYNITYYYYFSKQYEKVLLRIDVLLDELKDKDRLYYQALGMQVYCFIFLNKPDAVRKYIPQNVQQLNLDEYVQFRIAEMILWYLDDDIAGALRECENIKRMLKGKSEDERRQTVIDFVELVNLYKHFFEAVSSVAPQKKDKLIDIARDLHAFSSAYAFVVRQAPALAWLQTRISEIIV